MSAYNIPISEQQKLTKESFYSFDHNNHKLNEMNKFTYKIGQSEHFRIYDIHFCGSFTNSKRENKAEKESLTPLQLEYMQRLAKENTSTTIAMEKLEEEKKELEKRNLSVTNINSKLQKDCERVQIELQKVLEEVKMIKNEKSILIENNTKNLEKIQDLERRNSELEKQLRTTEHMIENNNKDDTYIENIKRLEKENIELIEVLERVDKELERFKYDNKELKSANYKLEDEIKALEEYTASIKDTIVQFDNQKVKDITQAHLQSKTPDSDYLQLLVNLKDEYNSQLANSSKIITESNNLSEKIRVQSALLEKQSTDIAKLNKEVYDRTQNENAVAKRLHEAYRDMMTAQYKYDLVLDVNKRYKRLFEHSLKELSRFDKYIFLDQQPETIVSTLEFEEIRFLKVKLEEYNKHNNSNKEHNYAISQYEPQTKLENTSSSNKEPSTVALDRSVNSISGYISKSMQELYKKVIEFEYYKKEVRVNEDMLEKFRSEFESMMTASSKSVNSEEILKPLEVECSNWKLVSESLLVFLNKSEVYNSLFEIQSQISQSMKNISKLYIQRKTNDTSIEKMRANFLTHIDSRELDILLEKRNDIKKLLKEEKTYYLKASKKFSELLNSLKRELNSKNMFDINNDPTKHLNDKILDNLKSKKVKDFELKMSFYEHTDDKDLKRLLD